MAQAIALAYQQRDQLAVRGAAGRSFVVANHSRQAVTKQYDRLLRTIVGEPAGVTASTPSATTKLHRLKSE